MLPYRGGKGRQWEGGIRVPFYIKAPGITRAGSLCGTPVTGADFFPTMLDLAGLDLMPEQHVDGVSLKPLLKGSSIPERAVFWHYPHYGNQGGEPSSIIIKGEYKLIHYYEDVLNELYRPGDDIGEQNDLAKSEPERVGALWKDLDVFLKSSGAKIPMPYDGYDPAWAEQKKQGALKQKASLEKSHAAILEEDWQPNKDWWGSLTTQD
jgi:arylsulfatase A-like enzyme